MAQLSQLITQTVGSSTAGVNLITAPNQASIWTPTTISVATTTTAAELPLGPSIAQAAKFSLAGSAGSAYVDFDVPSALINTKLEIAWYARASVTTIGSITLSLASYASAANRTSNTSPTTVTLQTSSVQSAAQSFQTTFDANSQGFYRLTLNFPAASGQWYSIAQMQVGPGQVVQGAAVSNSIAWTPTGSWTGGNVTYTGDYQRVGNFGNFHARIALSGTPTGTTLTVNMPTGLTIDTSLVSVVVGTNTFGRAHANANGTAMNFSVVSTGSASTVQLYFQSTASGTSSAMTGVSNTVPVSWTSPSTIDMYWSVPIAEWAGSGTVNLGPGAQVEYASNSSTSDAPDTSSFVNSPTGSAFPGNLTTHRSKRIQFQYPVQSDEMLYLEASYNGGAFVPLSRCTSGAGEYAIQESFTYVTGTTGAQSVGVAIAPVSGSATQFDVNFGRYARADLDGGNPKEWSYYASYKWRVRKAKASSPVGFGKANSSEFGLVAPRRGQQSLTVTGSVALTAYRAVGIYYQDQDGNHRLKFNITSTCASGSRTGNLLTITGVTFRNVADHFQAVSAFNGAGTASAATAYTNPGNGIISIEHPTATTTRYNVSGDVELESKPTWA